MSLIDMEVSSPNFGDRTEAVSMLVLHYTGMKDASSALERLCDRASGVSAHYLVFEDGRVVSLVPEDRRAWHAGVAYWRGIRDVNSASVGIEIVNGGHDFGLPDYPDEQMDSVIDLAQGVIGRHGIEAVNIVGHSDIAPSRKRDPGEKFPWRRLAGSGVGIWPPEVICESGCESSQGCVRDDLERIGYDVSVDLSLIVSAFQRRWRPSEVSGRLDDRTVELIGLVASCCVG